MISATKLTIAIPSYNGEKTIGETLDSMVTQIQPGVEILVSDNASTDGTAAIVKKYQNSYPYIRYVRNEVNVGADRNFDLAVRKSYGEYVWLVSDDDILNYGAIAKVLSVINNNLVAAIFANWTNMGGPFENRLGISHDTAFDDPNDFLSIANLYPLLVSSLIIRRIAWNDINTEEFIGTNWIHYLTLIKIISGAKSYIIAEPIVQYRTNNSDWKRNYQILLRNCISLFQGLTKLFTIHGLDPRVLRSLEKIGIKELPSTISGLKLDSIAITKGDLRACIDLFYRQNAFWLKCVPRYFMPKPIHRVLRAMKETERYIRHRVKKWRT